MQPMQRWPNRNPNIDPDDPDAEVISERELKMFIMQVYFGGTGLCLLSGIPWLCVSALKPPVQRDVPVPPFIWLITSFVLLTVLSCIPQNPVTRWMCWGLVLGSVMFITMFACYYMVNVPIWLALSAMAGSVLLLCLLHVYGAMAPMVILPNALCTCFVVLLSFITLFVLIMMSVFTNEKRYILASAIVFFILVVFLSPFHASFNCGRFRRVPMRQTAMCANGIFMHFWFLMTCLIIFVEVKIFDI